MATRVISTSIQLDGEQEFNKQLSAVNRELRNLKSEMALTEEQFRGSANSLEALTAKSAVLRQEIDQQTEKVNALERAVKESVDVFGDADSRTDKYRQSLNRAKMDLLKMERELQDTDRYMEEAQKSTNKTAKSIDEFGKETEGASVSLESLKNFDFSGFASQLKSIKGVAIGAAVAVGVKEVADGITQLEESTREYRRIMGSLEVSSASAGYSAEETADAYSHLYAVLGDNQTAATTVANLQAIHLEQADLIDIIDGCTGAWATYGDSIPIDSLAESVNETIQVGKVTGTFADALNWAGASEDAFNAVLSAANSSTERAQLVLDFFVKHGLTDAGQAWRDINQDVVDANEAQDNWEQAVGGLGDTLAPAAAKIRDFGANAINWLTDQIKDGIHWIDLYWNTQGQGAPNSLGTVGPNNKVGLSTASDRAYSYLQYEDTKAQSADAEAYNRELEVQAEKLEAQEKKATASAKRAATAHMHVKTAAERSLTTFKNLVADMDHLRKMDQMSDAEYYMLLGDYRDQYLRDDANLPEYRRITEQIYAYDQSLAKAEEKLWEEQTKKLSDEMDGRIDAVTKKQDAMADKLGGYGNLFEISKHGHFDLGDLDAQTKVIDRYEEALGRLQDRGIASGLLDEVTGMSIDDASRYAAELLAMSDKDFDTYNEAWAKKQQRAEEVAAAFYEDQLEAIGTEYNDRLGQTLGELTDTAFDSGQDTVQGLIDGMASKEGKLYSTVQGMADTIAGILGDEASCAATLSRTPAAAQTGVSPEQMTAAVVNGINLSASGSAPSTFRGDIVVRTEDGRELGRYVSDFVREEDRSNPEVRSDKA